MKNQNYIIEFQQVKENKEVTSKGCNAIIFSNMGVATAYVNKRPIATDKSWTVAGLAGEHDQTIYKVQFEASGTKDLYVEIKYYVD